MDESQAIGSSSEMVWTGINCTIATDQSDGVTREVVVVAPPSGSFSVSLRYRDGCGDYHVPGYANPSYNTSLFAASSINGQPCSAPQQPRPAVYPNPAANCLTVERLRGHVQLYNAQGRVVWQANVGKDNAFLIDTRALPNGLYYLAGENAEGQPARQSLQIQH